MSILLANIIRVLHFLLVAFLILAPFTNNILIIFLNLVMMAGIMFHWALNNQTCCLTICEKMLRGKELDSETFFGNLMGPVYSANETVLSWVFILVLFAYNLKKFKEKKSQLKSKWETLVRRRQQEPPRQVGETSLVTLPTNSELPKPGSGSS